MKKLKEIIGNLLTTILLYCFLLFLRLLFILIPILLFVCIFCSNAIFVIIKQFIIYRCVDWETKIVVCSGHHCNTKKIMLLKDALIDDIIRFIALIITCLVIYIIWKTGNIKNINQNLDKYYNKFTSKFNNSIDYFPSNIDIQRFFKPVKIKDNLGTKLLKLLIVQKIQIFNNMTLLQQYNLLFTENVQKINIGDPSIYGINDNFEINTLLYEIQAPDYISLKIVSSQEIQGNITNTHYYKNENNNKVVLQLVFDQYLIIKDIILKAFLNEDIDNDYIK